MKSLREQRNPLYMLIALGAYKSHKSESTCVCVRVCACARAGVCLRACVRWYLPLRARTCPCVP